jgi:cytochrome c556
MKQLAMIGSAAVLALALSACGGGEEAAPAADAGAATETAAAAPASSDPTPAQTIEARRANLKDLGASFKTINDQLKADAPDMAAIQTAAGKMSAYANEIDTWFPVGTGPEAGVETEALPTIWQDAPGFATAATNLKGATATLVTAAASGDPAMVRTAIPGTGGACKGCHDTYRLKKD